MLCFCNLVEIGRTTELTAIQGWQTETLFDLIKSEDSTKLSSLSWYGRRNKNIKTAENLLYGKIKAMHNWLTMQK